MTAGVLFWAGLALYLVPPLVMIRADQKTGTDRPLLAYLVFVILWPVFVGIAFLHNLKQLRR